MVSDEILRRNEDWYDDGWQFLIVLGCDKLRDEWGVYDSDSGVKRCIYSAADGRVATVCILIVRVASGCAGSVTGIHCAQARITGMRKTRQRLQQIQHQNYEGHYFKKRS
jgi:hypothetical protein